MSREMKDSGIEWIGDIPRAWGTLALKRCFSQRDGGAWGTEQAGTDNDLICIRIADFDYSRMSVKKNHDFTVRNYEENIINRLLLKKYDILIEKSGGGELTPVGRTIIFEEDFPALFANFMDRLRVSEKYIPKFMQYIFVTFYKNGYSKLYIKQTTGIQNLDITSMLATEKVMSLPLTDQQHIADYLDKKCAEIDSIIENTKASIKEYKAYKQSVITEAVTKGLNPNETMKDSGVEWIGEIPEHWETIKLKYIFSIKKDIVNELGYEILSVTQSGLKIKDISNNEGQISADYSKYQLVDIDDFVMNHMDLLTGWVDCSKYLGVTSPDYRVFKLIKAENHCKEFYTYLFQICYKNKIFYGLGQGVSNLGRWRLQTEKFINFMLPLLPLQEQQDIVYYLDQKCTEIDNLISQKQQLISELENYKKSLIYECVTGKREV